MEKLNFSHLFYFYMVVKEGSIKEASAKLFVTQPTISDQIKVLEEFFGMRLFDRIGRNLIVNRYGKVVLEYAEEIFRLEKELISRVKHRQDIPKKSIDIGITQRMNQSFEYSSLLELFKQKDLAVNFKEGERHHLIADLENNDLDIVFSLEKEIGNKNLNSFKFGKNMKVILGSKKFKKMIKNIPADLNDVPFFHYSKDSPLRHEIDTYFTQNSIAPCVIGEGDDVLIHEQVVANSIGITIVPEGAAMRLLENNSIYELGRITELDSQVWGIVRSTYKGYGHQLLKGATHAS